ncbi:unnamed protein product [Amoebophrya sp. A25]|nr:unnamed protein product [Amoebophrya sp. A25]|eukprot:GSA25T00015211001.1
MSNFGRSVGRQDRNPLIPAYFVTPGPSATLGPSLSRVSGPATKGVAGGNNSKAGTDKRGGIASLEAVVTETVRAQKMPCHAWKDKPEVTGPKGKDPLVFGPPLPQKKRNSSCSSNSGSSPSKQKSERRADKVKSVTATSVRTTSDAPPDAPTTEPQREKLQTPTSSSPRALPEKNLTTGIVRHKQSSWQPYSASVLAVATPRVFDPKSRISVTLPMKNLEGGALKNWSAALQQTQNIKETIIKMKIPHEPVIQTTSNRQDASTSTSTKNTSSSSATTSTGPMPMQREKVNDTSLATSTTGTRSFAPPEERGQEAKRTKKVTSVIVKARPKSETASPKKANNRAITRGTPSSSPSKNKIKRDVQSQGGRVNYAGDKNEKPMAASSRRSPSAALEKTTGEQCEQGQCREREEDSSSSALIPPSRRLSNCSNISTSTSSKNAGGVLGGIDTATTGSGAESTDATASGKSHAPQPCSAASSSSTAALNRRSINLKEDYYARARQSLDADYEKERQALAKKKVGDEIRKAEIAFRAEQAEARRLDLQREKLSLLLAQKDAEKERSVRKCQTEKESLLEKETQLSQKEGAARQKREQLEARMKQLRLLLNADGSLAGSDEQIEKLFLEEERQRLEEADAEIAQLKAHNEKLQERISEIPVVSEELPTLDIATKTFGKNITLERARQQQALLAGPAAVTTTTSSSNASKKGKKPFSIGTVQPSSYNNHATPSGPPAARVATARSSSRAATTKPSESDAPKAGVAGEKIGGKGGKNETSLLFATDLSKHVTIKTPRQEFPLWKDHYAPSKPAEEPKLLTDEVLRAKKYSDTKELAVPEVDNLKEKVDAIKSITLKNLSKECIEARSKPLVNESVVEAQANTPYDVTKPTVSPHVALATPRFAPAKLNSNAPSLLPSSKASVVVPSRSGPSSNSKATNVSMATTNNEEGRAPASANVVPSLVVAADRSLNLSKGSSMGIMGSFSSVGPPSSFGMGTAASSMLPRTSLPLGQHGGYNRASSASSLSSSCSGRTGGPTARVVVQWGAGALGQNSITYSSTSPVSGSSPQSPRSLSIATSGPRQKYMKNQHSSSSWASASSSTLDDAGATINISCDGPTERSPAKTGATTGPSRTTARGTRVRGTMVGDTPSPTKSGNPTIELSPVVSPQKKGNYHDPGAEPVAVPLGEGYNSVPGPGTATSTRSNSIAIGAVNGKGDDRRGEHHPSSTTATKTNVNHVQLQRKKKSQHVADRETKSVKPVRVVRQQRASSVDSRAAMPGLKMPPGVVKTVRIATDKVSEKSYSHELDSMTCEGGPTPGALALQRALISGIGGRNSPESSPRENGGKIPHSSSSFLVGDFDFDPQKHGNYGHGAITSCASPKAGESPGGASDYFMLDDDVYTNSEKKKYAKTRHLETFVRDENHRNRREQYAKQRQEDVDEHRRSRSSKASLAASSNRSKKSSDASKTSSAGLGDHPPSETDKRTEQHSRRLRQNAAATNGVGLTRQGTGGIIPLGPRFALKTRPLSTGARTLFHSSSASASLGSDSRGLVGGSKSVSPVSLGGEDCRPLLQTTSSKGPVAVQGMIGTQLTPGASILSGVPPLGLAGMQLVQRVKKATAASAVMEKTTTRGAHSSDLVEDEQVAAVVDETQQIMEEDSTGLKNEVVHVCSPRGQEVLSEVPRSGLQNSAQRYDKVATRRVADSPTARQSRTPREWRKASGYWSPSAAAPSASPPGSTDHYERPSSTAICPPRRAGDLPSAVLFTGEGVHTLASADSKTSVVSLRSTSSNASTTGTGLLLFPGAGTNHIGQG